jgi:uncharacterized protein
MRLACVAIGGLVHQQPSLTPGRFQPPVLGEQASPSHGSRLYPTRHDAARREAVVQAIRTAANSREIDTLSFLFVLAVGLVAGTISGIVGTGSSIMLMPVLIYEYGPKQAVPIMAIAAVMSNLSRILAWYREVDWRACAAYSVPAIPAAALGARTLLVLPSHIVDISIGLFLIAMVPARHWLASPQFQLSLLHLAIGGTTIGYITGIVVSTGPLSVPLFLFYGLTKGAFLATEAASSLGMYVSKSVTFQRFGALTPDVALQGLIAGSSLMFGAFIAKRFVLHLKPDAFRLLMDGIMVVAGLSMLWTAFS